MPSFLKLSWLFKSRTKDQQQQQSSKKGTAKTSSLSSSLFATTSTKTTKALPTIPSSSRPHSSSPSTLSSSSSSAVATTVAVAAAANPTYVKGPKSTAFVMAPTIAPVGSRTNPTKNQWNTASTCDQCGMIYIRRTKLSKYCIACMPTSRIRRGMSVA